MLNKNIQGVSGAEKRNSSLQASKTDVKEIFQLIFWQEDHFQAFNICSNFVEYIQGMKGKAFFLSCT